MPTPRRKRDIKPDRVRALELLAGCGSEGCAEATLLWHGVTIGQIVESVRAGRATVTAARVAPDNRTIDVRAGPDHGGRAADAGKGTAMSRKDESRRQSPRENVGTRGYPFRKCRQRLARHKVDDILLCC